jgi:hypothetical protein
MIREHFLTIDEADAWSKHLPCSRSVFGSHGFARINRAFRGSSPRLYVAQTDDSTICYPVLFRSISELPFASGTEGKWDTTTPDFTGPIVSGQAPELVSAFPALRDAAFLQEGVVAEFAHLHPWGEIAPLLRAGREYSREIVWVDTSLNPGELWNTQFEHSCRKNIRTAQKQNVKIREGSTDDHIREFYRIYLATMKRANALPAYYFSFEFFKAFRDEIPDNCRFVMAEVRDQIVAGTLYLHDDNDVYSYLGGADAEFQNVRPTNLLIWETIQWAHNAGKKRLILGGGYRPDDGIFRFKATFSQRRQSFHVYKRVHREGDYTLLDRLYREHHAIQDAPIAYFPSYRDIGNA